MVKVPHKSSVVGFLKTTLKVKYPYELQGVLIRPIYSDGDGEEIAGDFIDAPDEYCTQEMIQYVYRFIEEER